MRKAGLQGISLHSLRHTHGSMLLSRGVPLPVVSRRLGHSSVNTTANIYAHAFTADELAAARDHGQPGRSGRQFAIRVRFAEC